MTINCDATSLEKDECRYNWKTSFLTQNRLNYPDQQFQNPIFKISTNSSNQLDKCIF